MVYEKNIMAKRKPLAVTVALAGLLALGALAGCTITVFFQKHFSVNFFQPDPVLRQKSLDAYQFISPDANELYVNSISSIHRHSSKIFTICLSMAN